MFILRNANKLTFCLCELCENLCVLCVEKTVVLNTKFTKVLHKGHKGVAQKQVVQKIRAATVTERSFRSLTLAALMKMIMLFLRETKVKYGNVIFMALYGISCLCK